MFSPVLCFLVRVIVCLKVVRVDKGYGLFHLTKAKTSVGGEPFA